MGWKSSFAAILCVALSAFATSPAKALLINGSYEINLLGSLIDPSRGTFTVRDGNIENFTLDLLSGGVSANASSRYEGVPGSLFTVTDGSMFAGTAFHTGDLPDTVSVINFNALGRWFCTDSFVQFCSSSGGPLQAPPGQLKNKVFGTYTITVIPLPGAAWLLLTALAGLGVIGGGRRLLKRDPAAA